MKLDKELVDLMDYAIEKRITLKLALFAGDEHMIKHAREDCREFSEEIKTARARALQIDPVLANFHLMLLTILAPHPDGFGKHPKECFFRDFAAKICG